MYKDSYPPLEPECFYHIYNRGINGEDLFKEECNYDYFKTLLVKHVSNEIDILAYCLMKNHFHFCIQLKKQKVQQHFDVSKKFSNLFNAYTKTINKHYNRTGSLFETPFKRKKVSSDFYITQLIYYVHANPQKHGFTTDFKMYLHSSYNDILNRNNTIVSCTKITEWFGDINVFINYHKNYQKEVMNLSSFD